MTAAAEATPTPAVATAGDGLPQISREYLEEYERFVQTIVTEDGAPLDNIFSAKQARLLVESLYASWQHPELGRRFIADGNVGVFYALRRPPVVPNMFLSLDVTLPADIWKKTNRSYFIWEYGKPPEVVVEIVSNEEGDEERADGKLRIYAQMGVVRYVVYDPALHTGSEPLRLYALMHGRLRRTDETWFDEVQLGVMLWRGVYEEREDIWLRWCDRNGVVVPTGAERAEAERRRAERLAAKLRAAGIDPED
ncbi:MAG: Uma2 family endonuclease [Anaerolineae bacterium]|nr:Uma2 family endonuclease [Anaerolineae bacterium]